MIVETGGAGFIGSNLVRALTERGHDDVANVVMKWHGKGKIRYVPFPEHLKGAYQSFTQADIGELRKSGCDVEFRGVEDGVKNYLDQIA